MRPRMLIALAAATALALAACGDDDDADEATTAAPATTPAPATTAAPAPTAAPVTTAPAPTAAPVTTAADARSGEASGSAEADPFCALVLELYNQESPPTADQLADYQRIAPAEIEHAVSVAAPKLIAAGDDMTKFFAIYAQDDVEQAVDEINEFENATCGTEHEFTTPPAGASNEVEAGANQVDVVASEYAFDMPDEYDAGRTSFVLTNQGHEAHFLLIARLADGVTLEDALQSDDDSLIEGIWETGLAAPGGEDDEVITFDLEAGTYGAVCFVSGPGGTPHAFMGMQKEFTVS